MTPEELPKAEKDSKPLDAELRRDLLKTLVFALPILLVGMSVDWVKNKFENSPGAALWIIIPGIIVLCLMLLTAITRQKLKLGWPFVVFLAIYMLVFSIAAETSVLDWKRSLVGYDDVVPNNFLALNRFGNWHYRFASGTANQDLAIVLMKPPETPMIGRLQIADLITYAKESQAKGIAFDFYFPNTENGEELNKYLCQAIDEARGTGKTAEPSTNSPEWPVLVGHDFELGKDRIERIRIDPYLEHCLPESNQGHAVGYAEWDGVIRSIPMFLVRNSRSFESLSLRIAQKQSPQVKIPDNGLLQFTKPAQDFEPIKWAELWGNYNKGDESKIGVDRRKLQDRFVLVGEDSNEDRFPTPYGVQPGVVIHAYAVHSLTHHRYIERPRWWVTLLTIFLVCYLLMVLTARGVGNLKLVLINVGFSAVMVAIALLVMYFWLAWIDLVYPLVATWLFLLLLIGFRRVGMGRARRAAV
jgi:CHASE2 domain-containing sensor protein